ncbi:polysaccharide ABC transporter ATP-binding protein [Lentisphaera profundi]|uniref:Polysaccharide ABC transporter ATP-binding protein n=1 Tax=Lentisphaera profundi TaxID=1658616 RepID=A0ABY7VQK6_9BACT|nr:polysaccharide ABC transporter ATP-binding protein [Lentisphaera profundi]WDE95977.1 polysaccharide ABC transporter ATP-binding protein [Lentisphaera profundi]
MSESIITVENLSKSYTLKHQQEAHYSTLRDTLVNGVKGFGKKLLGRSDPDFQEKEEFWALKDINFEIKQGDRVGIIGRNGAGKSTLLKVLSRITEPTMGRIHLKGRVASLLEVGTGFHPELTGRENIFLNGAIMGMSKWEIKKKFDEIVAFAEVEKFLDTPVKRYSSGMYVRLAFAVAAHLEPEILVVDEVLAVGDAQFQKKCLGKMEDVGKEGRTVIFVSHNMDMINHLCENAILLEEGNIIDYRETEVITQKYLSDRCGVRESGIFKFKNNREKGGFHEVIFGDGKTNSVQFGNMLTIKIVFELKEIISGFHVALHLSKSNGSVIFTTADTDLNKENFTTRPAGIYTTTLLLPVNSLNTDIYYIRLSMGIPGTEIIDEAKELPLEVVSNDQMLYDAGNKRGGLLVEKIGWTYE